MNVQTLLGLSKPPVAVGYLKEAPADLPAWAGEAVPAGCVFWKKAQEGLSFYTTPVDHYNCAIGAYTHKIPLPVERAGELEGTIGFMVESHYLAMAEVPGIPTLPATPPVTAYGPVEQVSFAPDIVIVAAQPAQAMVLYEAALQAGIATATLPTLGRPACAALPLALQSEGAALSLGCKGNRTFTGLPDDELYLVVPGEKWAALVKQIIVTCQANATMGAHYTQHKAKFADA